MSEKRQKVLGSIFLNMRWSLSTGNKKQLVKILLEISLSYFLVIQFSFCFSPHMPFLSFLSLKYNSNSGVHSLVCILNIQSLTGHRTPLSVAVVTVFNTCFYCFLFHYLNNYAAGLLRMCSKEEKNNNKKKKELLRLSKLVTPWGHSGFIHFSFFREFPAFPTVMSVCEYYKLGNPVMVRSSFIFMLSVKKVECKMKSVSK